MLNSQLQLQNYQKEMVLSPRENQNEGRQWVCVEQAWTGCGPSGPEEGLLPTQDVPSVLRWAELANSFIRMQTFLLCLARMEKGWKCSYL